MNRQKLVALANFLRLLDEDGNLSISNLAVMVMVAKIALTAAFSMSEAAVLLPVLANYTFKRYHVKKSALTKVSLATTSEAKLEAALADISQLQTKLNVMGMSGVQGNRR